MKAKGKFFILLSFLTAGSANLHAACVLKSCDPTLIYAIHKQRNALEDRLNDLNGAIKATTKELQETNILLTVDIFELMRLRQRYRIRLNEALVQSKHMETLEKTIEAGGSINSVHVNAMIDKISTQEENGVQK